MFINIEYLNRDNGSVDTIKVYTEEERLSVVDLRNLVSDTLGIDVEKIYIADFNIIREVSFDIN